MLDKTFHTSSGSHVVKFNEEDHHLNSIVHHWEHSMKPEEVARIMHQAKHGSEGKYHLDDGQTTLRYHDGNFTLEKRHSF